MSIIEGQLVLWKAKPELGLAKVQSVTGNLSRISYFVSLARQNTFEVAVSELKARNPWPQTRVYVNQKGVWRMGRLTELRQGGEDFLVRFPNGLQETVPESDLYVRSSGAVEPMEVLKLHGHETPYFFEKRWPLVKHLVEQRAASAGIPALLSSAMDLRSHQVDVVRQVLHDPVQRYLLADEVGLGKTIEAGIIIRQLLIDRPRSTITVLVPAHLVGQWTDELARRFRIGDFPHSTVHVLVHGTLSLPKSDLLVVDEAHHLAAQAFGRGLEVQGYQRLVAAAQDAPRVLLLSATPASSNYRAYLGMLHLLDPQVYPLKDEAAFDARVKGQIAIGNAVFALQSDVPVMLLDTVFDDLLHTFPDDQRIATMIRDLRGDCPNPPSMVAALRAYISETYRLHRRMLRHRRETHAEDLVRGRKLGAPINVELSSTAGAWEAFDGWREVLEAQAVKDERAEAVAALAEVWSAALIGIPEWCEAVSQRQCQKGISSREQEMLNVLANRLHQLDNDAAENEVARAVVQAARQVGGKSVVFLSSANASARLLSHLERLLGSRRAALASQGAAAVKWFREHQDALVLVVDKAGEEGLNLQCANAVIHVDLPLDARRLEQRIGRLDRYGRGDKIVSRVLKSSAWPDVVRQHVELLEGPLNVHNTSVASLQTLLDSLLDEFLQAALEGAAAQRHLASTLPVRLELEMERVQQTEMLDSIQFNASQVLETQMDALYEMEAQGFDKSFTHWVHSVLHFKTDYDTHSIQFSFNKEKTLVNWERLEHLNPLLKRASTFSRRDAQRHGLVLLRSGEPFVDAMARYLAWDDRGRSYAYWRDDLQWEGDDLITFALHFTVSGDLKDVSQLAQSEHLDIDSLGRRMDGLLGPTTWTIYLDQDGHPVTPEAQSLLAGPYQGKVDHNLGVERVWALEEIAPPGIWTSMCDHVLTVADAQMRTNPAFITAIDQAQMRARSMMDERLSILRSRQVAGQRDSSAHELAVEEQLAQALMRGIVAPAVVLDAVGAVILSRRNPFERE